MKKIKIFALALVILSTFSACTRQLDDNRTVIKEPDKNITIIDNEETKYEEPSISVDKILKFDVVEISDWLDEQNLIVTMENRDLEKMNLLELSDQYSRGIYQYNIETKEIKPLKVREDMFLGGAKLSPDKEHLLYYEYSIGDAAFYVISMDEDGQDNHIKDEVLGLAISAKWTDDNEIIGLSYAGGVYRTDENRELLPAYDLQDEQLYTVVKNKNKVYYVTITDTLDMYILDLETNTKKKLKIENAESIIPSPDGNQILITQSRETDRKLHVADADGNILRTIAEGTEITGVSWSPDQMMIAYQLRTLVNGVESRELYIYDVLAGEPTRIAVNYSAANIVWSPSGDKLAVSQYSDTGYINPSIFYLNERNTNQTKDMGYITAIDTENKTISVDRAELLYEKDEERIAELKLTADDLATGFYIYNEDDSEESITYEENIIIELLDGTLQLESSVEDLKEVLTRGKILANLTLIDNKVVKISEQYIP